MKKAMLWRDFRQLVAEATGSTVDEQRMWLWSARENHTYR